MKLSKTAWLCLATLPSLCAAQAAPASTSSVQLYGRVDASVNLQKRSVTSGTLKSVSSETSYFGFRGNEDLGGGSRAYFKLESLFDTSSGAIPGAAF